MIAPTYYAVLDCGKHGLETTIDWDRCAKSDVIARIMSGDYVGSLVEVHCIDREDGRWSDVSEDIAREIVATCRGPLHPDLLAFLEQQLGSALPWEHAA